MALFAENVDAHWERWGQENPYYGVLTEQQFLNSNLTDQSLAEFFKSGERHVDRVMDAIQSRLQSRFTPRRILDYGCGPARLVIPFSRFGKEIVGIDVSRPMLQEAIRNCEKYGVKSAHLLHVSELASLAPSSFDLVHSFMVMQHIPVRRGEAIFKSLIDLLADDGIGAIHLTYSHTGSRIRHLASTWRSHSALLNGILNLSRGHSFGRPSMLMSHYSLNRIFDLLFDAGCTILNVEFTSDHCGCHGAMFYFTKSRSPLLPLS